MFPRFRNHLVWDLLGIVAVLGMWFAYSVPGAVALFAAIGSAFLLWRFLGSRGSWVALAVIGLSMSSLLGWQAVTSARCPAPGERIIIKDNKPPVSCDELRASAAAMSVFFGLIALFGLAAPLYARTPRDGDDADDADDTRRQRSAVEG